MRPWTFSVPARSSEPPRQSVGDRSPRSRIRRCWSDRSGADLEAIALARARSYSARSGLGFGSVRDIRVARKIGCSRTDAPEQVCSRPIAAATPWRQSPMTVRLHQLMSPRSLMLGHRWRSGVHGGRLAGAGSSPPSEHWKRHECVGWHVWQARRPLRRPAAERSMGLAGLYGSIRGRRGQFGGSPCGWRQNIGPAEYLSPLLSRNLEASRTCWVTHPAVLRLRRQPQTNGVAERFNRTHEGTASSMVASTATIAELRVADPYQRLH